jgi:hypothetical protein
MQGSEMMYPPVKKQLHSWAKFLAARVKQGGPSYIDEAIDLDREGTTCLFLSPFRAVK